MTVKIRLSRGGSKKKPYYRIVVADSRAPRDGSFLEKIGTYNPLLQKDNDSRVIVNRDRAVHWLNNGAQPTLRVIKFLSHLNIELPRFAQKVLNLHNTTRKPKNKKVAE